jgi:hypothetical protein
VVGVSKRTQPASSVSSASAEARAVCGIPVLGLGFACFSHRAKALSNRYDREPSMNGMAFEDGRGACP